MNKVLLSAGVVVLAGLVIMAVGEVMYYTASDDYWDRAAYGTVEEWIDAGKESEMFRFISSLGMIIVALGVALIAFGLAKNSK